LLLRCLKDSGHLNFLKKAVDYYPSRKANKTAKSHWFQPITERAKGGHLVHKHEETLLPIIMVIGLEGWP